jgi:hypothetical protein
MNPASPGEKNKKLFPSAAASPLPEPERMNSIATFRVHPGSPSGWMSFLREGRPFPGPGSKAIEMGKVRSGTEGQGRLAARENDGDSQPPEAQRLQVRAVAIPRKFSTKTAT